MRLACRSPRPNTAGVSSTDVTIPPDDASVVPLAAPLFVGAGAVNGTAVAAARSGADMYYLVDNAALGGPPVWIHERSIERCSVAAFQTPTH
jgi:small neutral amino acid transporter SnatA (MarC family)